MQRMIQYRLFALFILIYLRVATSYAQEVNFGINAGPIVSMPLIKKSSAAQVIKAQRFNINATAGLTINVRVRNICIETGANVSSRSVAFKSNLNNLAYNSLGGNSSLSAQTAVRASGYAYSVPLVVGYNLHDHKANTTYSVFGLLGASYDHYTSSGYTSVTSSVSVGGGTTAGSSGATSVENIAPSAGQVNSWVNIIAGFKINAIVRKIGLIDYGLRYHYPLSDAGRYNVSTTVSNGTYGSYFEGNFYPKLSYFDFHFTYYFFNLERGTGVKRYKNY